METALYFPYMRVPETSWFTQVILYWDNAASIVPLRTNEEDERRLGRYMSELERVHLLRRIHPDEILASGENFDARFLAFLDTQGLPTLAQSEQSERLHPGKASYRLFMELMERGLARQDDWWGWAVERTTAGLYMTYLVGSICRKESTLFPVTDATEILTSLASPPDTESRLRALRYVAITKSLPVPSRPVPPVELASFKEANGDQLRRLRCYLNGQMADLAAIDDEVLRQAKMDSILQEIHDDVAVLHEQMSRRSWPGIVFAGVAGLIASVLAVGGVMATGGTALALGLGISGGIAAIGPAAYQTTELLHSSRIDLRSPLAYAALAQAL